MTPAAGTRAPPATRRWVVALAVAAGLAGVAGPVRDVWRERATYADFTQDYASAREWADGGDPYAPTPDLVRRQVGDAVQELPDPHRNPHPPLQILVARPLAPLPYRAARSVWLVLGAAAIALAVGATAREVGASRAAATAIGAVSLALPTSRLDLADGQVNAFVLIAMVGGWIALRRGHDAAAGAALGFAAALKVIPLLLIVPLLRLRRFRAATWQVGTTAVLATAGGLAIGVAHSIRYVSEIAPENARYWRGIAHNISLTSVPFRWLSPNRWRPEAADLPVLAGILAIALGIGCVLAAARTPARASGDLLWATVPWMILASPLAWADYLVMVLPLVLLVFARSHGARAPPLLIAAVVAVVIGRPAFVFFVHPVSIARQLLVLSIPMYGLLALGALEWGRAPIPPARTPSVYPAEA